METQGSQNSSNKCTEISSLEIIIFDLKMMMKRGLWTCVFCMLDLNI